MAEMQIKGLEEYALALSRLGEKTEEITKEAVYEGAAVVADAIKAGLKTIPVDNRRGTNGEMLNGVTNLQKADLIDSFGLAPIQEFKKGYMSTKAGWDGYGRTKTKKYPNGQPNQMLMRAVESGTSFRKKSPVVRKAVNASRKRCQQVMGATIDKACKKLMD